MIVKHFVITALLTVFSLTTFATHYYKAKTTLNIRSGAGTGYSILFTIDKGEEVEIISKKNDWFEIKYNEKTGFAFSKYLEFAHSLDNGLSSETEMITRNKHQNWVFGVVIVSVLMIIILLLIGRNKKEIRTESRESIKYNKGVITDETLNKSTAFDKRQVADMFETSKMEKKEPSLFIYGLIFSLVGLVIGYLIYGKVPWLGEYIRPEVFFGINGNDDDFESMVRNAIIEPIRQKILISAIIGGIVGLVIALLKRQKS